MDDLAGLVLFCYRSSVCRSGKPWILSITIDLNGYAVRVALFSVGIECAYGRSKSTSAFLPRGIFSVDKRIIKLIALLFCHRIIAHVISTWIGEGYRTVSNIGIKIPALG